MTANATTTTIPTQTAESMPKLAADGIAPAPSSTELLLQQERKDTLRDTTNALETILNQVKGTTKKLLDEIGVYMEQAEHVRVDYARVAQNQRDEASRLQHVMPDVEGVTDHFVQPHMAAEVLGGARAGEATGK